MQTEEPLGDPPQDPATEFGGDPPPPVALADDATERAEYHALELGAGHSVVFLHDIFGSHEDFAGVMDVMADDWRTVGVDLPGHGKSTSLPGHGEYDIAAVAADLHSVLSEFTALPAALVGEGVGATIALEIAATHPGDVTALVLVSPGLGAEVDVFDDPAVAAWLSSEGDQAEFVDAVLPLRHCGRFFLDQPGRAGLERERLAQVDPEGVSPLAAAVRASGDQMSRLGALRTRVLVVSGDEDGIEGPARVRAIAERAAAPMAVIRDCGHLVSVEQPESLAELIGKHLDAR